jgi:hypothetical protein
MTSCNERSNQIVPKMYCFNITCKYYDKTDVTSGLTRMFECSILDFDSGDYGFQLRNFARLPALRL